MYRWEEDYGLPSAVPPRPKRDGFLWKPMQPGTWTQADYRQMYRIIKLVRHKLETETMPLDVRWDLEQRLATTENYLSLCDGFFEIAYFEGGMTDANGETITPRPGQSAKDIIAQLPEWNPDE